MNKPIVRVKAVSVQDGFMNFATRLGTSADRSAYGTYGLNPFAYFDLENAYRTSWLRKIVDIPPSDEVREWRTWTGGDPEQIKAIFNEELRLGLAQKVREAEILARKDGAAAILIGLGDDASKPVDPERISDGGVQYLSVCTRWEITPLAQDRDPASPTFGMPGQYRLNNQANTIIHPSRVVRFIGNPVRQRGYWDGWNGDPIWVELRTAIMNSDQIAAATATMVDEAKLDVVRLDNLMANMTDQKGEDLLVRRWSSVMQLKGVLNALVLDKNDEYEQKTIAFTGLTDIQNTALTIMSGMADIPATRLLGRSPAGMNATGESDMRNYYDRITARQKGVLGPMLKPLDDLLVRSAIGSYPDELYYEWNPLYSLSEKEAMEVEKIAAETLEKLAATGLVPDDALAEMTQQGIVERGQWPGAEQAFAASKMEPGILEEPTEGEIEAEEQAMLALAAPAARQVVAQDAKPRTLYVRRDVVNRADIVKWARDQGFTDIVPDLHVTIAHSTTPVDWFKVGTSWADKIEIAAGGPRQMEALGPTGKYMALLITANELVWRNREIRDAGASWDWPDYQPHISIQVGVTMPDGVKPYQGKIVLGPEIFEEVRDA